MTNYSFMLLVMTDRQAREKTDLYRDKFSHALAGVQSAWSNLLFRKAQEGSTFIRTN